MTDERKQIIFFSFFAVFIYVFYQTLRVFSPFFIAFFWSCVLTYAFFPLQQFLHSRFKQKTGLTAFVSTCAVVLVVVIPGVIIGQVLVQDILDGYQLLIEYLRGDLFQQHIQHIYQWPWVQWLQQKISDSSLIQEKILGSATQFSQFLANHVVGQFANLTKNAVLLILNLALIICLMFILFQNGHRLSRWLFELTPLEETDKKHLFEKINQTFSAVIRGQLLTSLVQGGLAGIIFYFLGIPMAVFWGFLTFVASMIPFFGSATVWVPFAGYLFLTGSSKKALILTLLGVFVISLSDNLIKPLVINQKVRLPLFLLFLSILGGLSVYGFTGIFLGPIVLTLFFVFIEIYQSRYFPSQK